MKKIILPGLLPLTLLILTLGLNMNRKLRLYPAKMKEINICTEKDLSYTNRNAHSWGTTRVEAGPKERPPLEVNFTLGKNRDSAFMRIVLLLQEEVALKDYNKITLELESLHQESCIIALHSPGPPLKRQDFPGPGSYYFKEAEIPLKKGRKRYTLSFSRFEIPVWWYVSYNISPGQIAPSTWDKLFQVDVATGSAPVTNRPDRFILYSIILGKQYTLLFIWTLGLGGAYLIYLSFLLLNRKNKVTVSYRKAELKDKQTEELECVQRMIEAHYREPEFSLNYLSRETGISEEKISSLIKNQYNLSFRQYLNALRLKEARKQLVETKLSILDIAYNAGYNTVSHFNRVFKQTESLSPREYRKKHHKHSLESSK